MKPNSKDPKKSKAGRPEGAVSTPKAIAPEHLAEFLKKTQEDLASRGVSKDRLPTNESLTSHLTDWLDPKKVEDWKEQFASLEAPRVEGKKE